MTYILRLVRTLAASLGLLALAVAARAEEQAAPPAAPRLSYNKDVRPLLVENCFSCHGADSASRKADLRLDQRDAAIEFGALVPGDPDSSTFLDRVYSDDPEEVMPPPSAKKTLTPEQKEILTRWVREGAEYEPHWSFIPPKRPELPAVKNESWSRNPIDRFILQRLEAEGLAPAPEADRRTLARRVALDLTGLPPEPALVEAFVADRSPDAYEQLVDRLLSSLDWGEHRGRHWLDYARYGDTNGIHIDNFRELWAYRQWVANAFNRNMPFDEFTILQLAGDLVNAETPSLPRETQLDNQIGSGFNRCNITTSEGGAIDEEYRVLYCRDRTETTAAVWMGLTTGCAVCHNHKFDPFSQKEFYELSAFFNNTTQPAMDGNVHDTPPIVPVPRPDDLARFTQIEQELPAARAAIEARKGSARPEFDAWITAASADTVHKLLPQDAPAAEFSFSEGQGSATKVKVAGAEREIALTAETTWQPGPPGMQGLLLNGKAAAVDGVGDFEQDQGFSLSFWIRPPANDNAYAVAARMDDAQAYRGWDAWIQSRKLGMHMVHAWPDDAMKVSAKDQLPADAWTQVAITYDGSGRPEGIKVFYNGKPQGLNIETNAFKKNTIKNQVPFTIGSRSPGSPAHACGIAGLSVWGRALADGEIEGLARGQALADIVRLDPAARPAAAGPLYDWWLATADEPFKGATARAAALDAEQAEIRRRGTVAHVMNEKPEMAKAYVLARGEYDKRTDEVIPDTPEILPPFPADAPRNRLGLARWLLLADHPLTSRTTVNRFWQEVFGTGLVRSSADLGVSGELPSHPELLDWLAVEFRETGWNVKRLFKLMVTSAAYRQSAATTPDKLVKDNANRLLSRGPRFRMDAEMVRDYALAASGLLVRQIGGPSVKPYQPDGVWEAVSMGGNTSSYKRDSGENLYRKSMYWFWKRTAPPASMEIFNAPSRETCTIRRDRTNTPLQALVTLNDPQFVESARALADRAWEIGGATDDARIDFIARRLVARPLSAEEMPIVRQSLADLLGHYGAHPEEAKQLISIGDSKPRHPDAAQLAAWTMLTNELMNLDEVLCK
jgi:cytochrome c553